MSAKTQIIVLHMKEVIYTFVFAGLSILLIFLFLYMFLPSKNEADNTESATYTAGVYTSSILFKNSAIDVQVVVDATRINSISLVNLNESVTTMYPLVEPALEELTEQILKKQSTEGISYSSDNQYTSLMLLDAINTALEKAATLP
ncbi:MAG: hypothetical protein IKB01_04720 [Lachnospiraceae bacterium]|nr:hypothetical protein [Lachnospiraceae bacterium]